MSLTDGREYVITGTSLVFGREAGCDVVVAGKDVSRRHAEIVQTPKGYLLVDSSTNGSFVNEERVTGQRILARADVIRLGDEQFRFYADVASTPPAAPAADVGGGGAERLKHTVHGMEAVAPPSPPAPTPTPPSPAARPASPLPLATFLVRVGTLAGRRLTVKTPVANLGRADYNDVVVPDPSVSTSHAKLQRREGVWVLVDLDSTNGTFVDGERVKGEAPLAPGAMVRLGDVQLVFEPSDDAVPAVKGGGTQVLRTPHSVAPPAPAKPASPAAPPAPPASPAPVRPPAAAGPKATAPPPRARPAAAKPAPKRSVAQQPPPPKKGKGCGASAAVLVLGSVGLAVLVHRLLL